jgi:PPK2 family polyphosphate:nucleotide phosphotransferase
MHNLKKESTLPKFGMDQKSAEAETEVFKEKLFELQNLLYANQKHSLLIILQGMDASGKDGTVRHVFSSMNPMGVNVKPFKAPTEEQKSHDFLWRIYPHVPPKGMIAVFNRSHYEDILVPVAHKDLDKKIIERRYGIINSFEESLQDSGTIILKFFLHISKKEQKRRLDERLTIPRKKWKYDPADEAERPSWSTYMRTYETIFDRCGKERPWIIVPSDIKWYRNYVIAKKITKTLEGLKMKYPI